jgi:hypothetical protein
MPFRIQDSRCDCKDGLLPVDLKTLSVKETRIDKQREVM